MTPKSDVQIPALSEVRALVRIAIWAALIALGGWISFPVPFLGGVPVSLQTFFVILAGLAEGPRNGALAAGLYLLAGFLGLPVFTGGLAGPAILLRPSAGFALAFPLGAALAGLSSTKRRGPDPNALFKNFLTGVLGSVAILAGGFCGLLVNTGMGLWPAAALAAGFLPGDIAKCVVAASLARLRVLR